MATLTLIILLSAALFVGIATAARTFPGGSNEAALTTDQKSFAKDFEPRPNVLHTETIPKTDFIKDFEPRPNVSAYGDDAKTDELIKDFEPRPNVSAYGDDTKAKGFVKDFEPRPNVSAYGDDSKLKGTRGHGCADGINQPMNA